MDDLILFESQKSFADCLEQFRAWRLQGHTIRGVSLDTMFFSGRKRIVAEEYRNVTEERYYLLVWYVDEGS